MITCLQKSDALKLLCMKTIGKIVSLGSLERKRREMNTEGVVRWLELRDRALYENIDYQGEWKIK